ncbi:MAG: topoisomerase C-terminal repeat-containing protein [Saprospiraceae bacterium]
MEKPRYANLRPGQSLETITMEEALNLFELPKNLGKYEDREVIIAVGRFGPYVKFEINLFPFQKEWIQCVLGWMMRYMS